MQLFIHDGRDGIYVEQTLGRALYWPKTGDRVAIDGITGQGLFAPVIKGRDAIGTSPSFITSPNGKGNHLSGDTVFNVANVTGDADLIVSNPLVITLPVRNGAAFSGTAPASATVAADGIVYEIAGSNDLSVFDQSVSEVVPALTGSPALPGVNSGWTYRTFRLDGAVGGGIPRGPKGFLSAGVAEAP